MQATYLAWADELLRRGFPQRAVEILDQAPQGDTVSLLKARALDRAGLFREALELLEQLGDATEAQALKGTLLWRLGRPEEAREAASQAVDGEPEARAEALNTLGHLAWSAGNYGEAVSLVRRASALWRSMGRLSRWADALNTLAVLRVLQNEPAATAFEDALEAASDNPLLRARVYLNQGWMHERQQDYATAEKDYRHAATLAETSGATTTAAWGWNNLGVLFHTQERPDDARNAYEQALRLAQEGGERRILGMVMANLAELTGDVDAWQEALYILEESGHAEEAEQYRMGLPADHPFRAWSEAP